MKQLSLTSKALEFYGNRLHHPGQWRVHTLARRLLKPHIDADVEVERGGLKWFLNPSDYVQAELFWLGERDRWDLYHVKRLLSPGAVVFDVGANFGHFSVSLAAHLGSQGRFFAFEPNPQTRTRLERNIALNQLGDMVTILSCALSDTTGMSRLFCRKDNTGAAYICDSGEIEIKLTTVDSICAQFSVSRLDFVKIDVEGFESHVLRGGEQSLRRLRPLLLVEVMEEQLSRAHSSPDELAALLRDYGYTLYEARRTRLLPLTELPRGSRLINILCVPR